MTTSTTVINTTLAPTGGVVVLALTSTDPGPWTLTRTAVSGPGAGATLYSGAPVANALNPAIGWTYVDMGDGTNLPLDPTTTYSWTLTTAAGAVTTNTLVPAVGLSLEYTDFTAILVKALQAALPNVQPPDGTTWAKKISPSSILTAMPITGVPTLPLVCVCPQLDQQDQVGIGYSVDTDNTQNSYNITDLALHRYSVAVFTATDQERDFYKQAIIAIWKSLLTPILTALGQDVAVRWQAASSQKTQSPASPGFYFCELGVTFTGVANVAITTDYGVIDTFAFNTQGTADTTNC